MVGFGLAFELASSSPRISQVVLQQCYDPALDPTAIEPVSLVVFALIGLLGGTLSGNVVRW